MLSYCYSDKDIVHRIEEHLTAAAYNVWLYRENVHGHSKA